MSKLYVKYRGHIIVKLFEKEFFCHDKSSFNAVLIIAFNFGECEHAVAQKKYVNAAVSFEFYCVNNNHSGYNVHICIKACSVLGLDLPSPVAS